MFWASVVIAIIGLYRLLAYGPRNDFALTTREPSDAEDLPPSTGEAEGLSTSPGEAKDPPVSAASAEGTPLLQSSPPRLSVIVPARNEETTLPRLLTSLQKLEGFSFEVLVVNDHSSDQTAAVAQSYGAHVIDAPDLPDTWAGKNWACYQGALKAQGEYLLFTDADTEIDGRKLVVALTHMQKNRIDLLSSVPYHVNVTLWEKSLASFHALLLMASSAFDEPRTEGLYAIGQFLLFKKESYWEIKGHEMVKASACDDIPLAQAILRAHMDYEVSHSPLYRVRMYENFQGFLAGWQRNFTWGFGLSDYRGGLRVLLTFFAATGGGQFFASTLTTAIMLTTWVALYFKQSRFGHYPLWSLLFVPWGLLVFCYVSARALFDFWLKRPVLWKGRSYKQS